MYDASKFGPGIIQPPVAGGQVSSGFRFVSGFGCNLSGFVHLTHCNYLILMRFDTVRDYLVGAGASADLRSGDQKVSGRTRKRRIRVGSVNDSYAAILLLSYKSVTLLRIFFGSKSNFSHIHRNVPISVSSLKNHALALLISFCFVTLELSALTCPFTQHWNASSNTADQSFFSGKRGSHLWLFVLAQNCTG